MAATTQFDDMEAYFRVAKYSLVKETDMHVETKEEVCVPRADRSPGPNPTCIVCI